MRLAAMLIAPLLLCGCARERLAAPPREARPGAQLTQVIRALEQAGLASGLGKPRSVRTYAPEKMFEAIDGEADLFLSYDARGLVAARYLVGKAIVDAEAFDQGEPINAFGVASQLAGPEAVPVAVGAGGVTVANEAVLFRKSRYFVRVSATGAERPAAAKLVAVARAIADRLKGSSALPPWTGVLPRPARTIRYVKRNVLGHGFLSNAMVGEYGLGEKRCTLAVVRAGNEAQAHAVWGRLRAAYAGGAAPPAWKGVGAEVFSVASTGERPMRAARSGRYLVVAVGGDDAVALSLVKATLDRLRDLDAPR